MMIMFVNNPQVLADDIEIFGGEFESETPPQTVQQPPAETPPTEVFNPPEPPAVVEEKPAEVSPPVVEVVEEQPQPEPEPPAVVEEPAEVPPPVVEVVEEQPQPEPEPPAVVEEEPATVDEPFNTPVDTQPTSEEEDFGDSLNFDDLNNNPRTSEEPAENLTPNYPARNNGSSNNTTVVKPRENNSASQTNSSTPAAKQQKLKVLPQRFYQVAVDEDYIYYLDKQSVSWKKIPYLTSEYMADVWIRMIERNPRNDDLPADLADYVNDANTDEITLAKAKGYQYTPEDVKVLRSKKYFLEHYYLRPQREQIQFLSELEVVGHPQNTAAQKKYDPNNWEELIPGSMESILYYSIIQVIGKSKASEKGHMTFFDMLEEYGRISIR